MTKENAIRLAQQDAKQHNTVIAVVDAPIENAEETDGPFGFAALLFVHRLFKYGKVVGFATADGRYLDDTNGQVNVHTRAALLLSVL